MDETHVMNLLSEHEGTEEWHCPICGRTLLIEWHPWRRLVTVKGDIYASHTGGKGGLSMGIVVRKE